MKLYSMAQKPGEDKEEVAEVAAEAKQPKFPYGLCITLNEEAIEKLGWKELPKVGSKCNIEAKGVVIGVRDMQGLEHSSLQVELQITDLGVEVGAGKSTLDTLYPEGGNTGLRGKKEY